MKLSQSFCVILTAGILSFGVAPAAFADHHETEALEGKIHEFYQNMSKGDFEAAFNFIADGARGYTHTGLLKELPNNAVKAMATSQMKQEREQGHTLMILPKHINITKLGDGVALATFYEEGKLDQPDDKPKEILNRSSLVLTKEGDAWKITHWHISKLETKENE